MRTSVSIAFFAAALCSSTLTPAAPPTTYRVTEFGADDSATKFTTVNGVNDLGQATVGVYTSTTEEGFVWQAGQLTPLSGLDSVCGPGAYVSPAGINNRGQVAVQVLSPDGSCIQSVLWQGGTVYDLNTLIAPNDPLKPYIKLLQAGIITDTGIILANGEDSRVPNNYAIQFILTPVP